MESRQSYFAKVWRTFSGDWRWRVGVEGGPTWGGKCPTAGEARSRAAAKLREVE